MDSRSLSASLSLALSAGLGPERPAAEGAAGVLPRPWITSIRPSSWSSSPIVGAVVRLVRKTCHSAERLVALEMVKAGAVVEVGAGDEDGWMD